MTHNPNPNLKIELANYDDHWANGSNYNCLSKKFKLSTSLFIMDSELIEEFAHHQSGIVHINNSSFGRCPTSIIATQKRWQLHSLQQPDDFFYNNLFSALNFKIP